MRNKKKIKHLKCTAKRKFRKVEVKIEICCGENEHENYTKHKT